MSELSLDTGPYAAIFNKVAIILIILAMKI